MNEQLGIGEIIKSLQLVEFLWRFTDSSKNLDQMPAGTEKSSHLL